MERLLKDGRLFKLLERVDWDLAQAQRAGACRYCGAKLHCGDFARKPRGGDPGWDKRYSFDCSRCRRRHTPPSVRFLGRKVYIGVVVVLAGAMLRGLKPDRVERLRQELGIDIRTLQRWRAWWMEAFVSTGFWKAAKGRFMPRVDERRMPLSLVERFGAQSREGMVKLLEFLAPITVPERTGVAAM